MPEILNPTDLEIRLLNSKCEQSKFDCGVKEVNSWFRQKTSKHHGRYTYRTHTAHLRGNDNPCGFYTLRLANGDAKYLSPEDSARHGPTDNFPAVQLTYIGVEKYQQGCGIGRILMGDVIDKFYNIANLAGAFALTLVAIDKDTAEFYRRLGFTAYGPNKDRPMMLLPAKSVFDLYEGD